MRGKRGERETEKGREGERGRGIQQIANLDRSNQLLRVYPGRINMSSRNNFPASDAISRHRARPLHLPPPTLSLSLSRSRSRSRSLDNRARDRIGEASMNANLEHAERTGNRRWKITADRD
jgi:hypothetical protein